MPLSRISRSARGTLRDSPPDLRFARFGSASFLGFLQWAHRRTTGPSPQLVELLPIELDSRNPQQKEFGRLEFLNGFQLRSRDRRFGGLSGLTIGADGRLYAVSDAGYWVSAQMIVDSEARLLDLSDWDIQPLLSTTGAPVTDPLHDAEALARAPDGSFMVAFEKVHRIWRYAPPPLTFRSLPVPVPIPAEVSERRPATAEWRGLPFFRMVACWC